MVSIPTVSVVGEDGGELRINKSDFDPKTHKIWEASEPEDKEPEAAPEEPEADDGLGEMTKGDLREKAWADYGVKLSQQMTKREMIAAIRDLRIAG
jgi:hypothetical protein